MKYLSLGVMAMFYTAAGVAHFGRPDQYLKIMPPFLPARLALVYISGGIEMMLGVMLLFPQFRVLAAWGVIALLIAVFPANIFMFQKGSAATGVPQWVLLLRLPLQGVLIAWAYWHTRTP